MYVFEKQKAQHVLLCPSHMLDKGLLIQSHLYRSGLITYVQSIKWHEHNFNETIDSDWRNCKHNRLHDELPDLHEESKRSVSLTTWALGLCLRLKIARIQRYYGNQAALNYQR